MIYSYDSVVKSFLGQGETAGAICNNWGKSLMNKRLRLPLALSLALGSSSAFALGLGQIEVKSALNQPLAAEIPVLSTREGETDAIVVRLAPPEALARVGLQAPSGVAANLQFAVDTNARGQTVIRVTTPGKVADPFLTFLLEVDWGKGKMLREYTVLLDPPTMAPVRHTPTAAPRSEPAPLVDAETTPLAEAPPPPPMDQTPAQPVAAEPAAETPPPEPLAEATPEPTPEPVAEAEPPAPASLPEPAPDAPRTRTDTYGPVSEGETLWSIAQFARPDDSVTMNQMMLALLYANPDAFIDQNINRLKRGAVLRIPAREEAVAIAAAEAAAQVREQSAAWRQSTASVLQPAEAQDDGSDDGVASTSSASPGTAESRLELVPPRGATANASSAQSGASVEGEGRELRTELARNREQVNALTQENVDLKSRVGELEKIQGDTARLIELKDSELAAAQKRLRELEARAAADASPATDAATPPVADTPATDETATDAAPTSPTAIDPAVPPLVEPPVVDSATPADPDSTTTTTPTTDAEAQPEAVPAETVAAETAPAEAVPAETTPVAEPVVDTAALPPRPAPTPWYMNLWVLIGAGLVVVGGLALMLARRRSSATVSSPARYDSGAVASSIAAVQASANARDADGSDDDRLDDLVAAVSRDPGNLNRHLDLVRHYYDTNDAAGFENAAEAMYSRVYDPDDLAWKQVMAMGQEIAPEHPLFVLPDEVIEPTPAPVPAYTPPPVVKPAPVVPPVVVAPPAPTPAVREIDWGLTAKPDADATQQMRLDDIRQAAPKATPPATSTVSGSFSFEPAPDIDVNAGSEGFVDADAASTKLELARAYLDMGDVEGARGMLEEVVSEGNPGQRAEAKRLLDEIR